MLRDLATIGIAVGAPVALLSGIFVGVTLVGGPNRFALGVFIVSVALTLLSVLAYAYAKAQRHSNE